MLEFLQRNEIKMSANLKSAKLRTGESRDVAKNF